jgi:hypothetical protein
MEKTRVELEFQIAINYFEFAWCVIFSISFMFQKPDLPCRLSLSWTRATVYVVPLPRRLSEAEPGLVDNTHEAKCR